MKTLKRRTVLQNCVSHVYHRVLATLPKSIMAFDFAAQWYCYCNDQRRCPREVGLKLPRTQCINGIRYLTLPVAFELPSILTSEASC